MDFLIIFFLLMLLIINIIDLIFIIQLQKNTYLNLGLPIEKLKEEIANIQRNEIRGIRNEIDSVNKMQREEIVNSFQSLSNLLDKILKQGIDDLKKIFKNFEESFNTNVNHIGSIFKERLEQINKEQNNFLNDLKTQQNQIQKTLEEKFINILEGLEKNAKQSREELSKSLKSFEDSFRTNVKDFQELQKQKFNDLISRQEKLVLDTEVKLEKIRETLETKINTIQENNNKKLEEIQQVVDEKLHSTLEKRLGESFRLVSERLEMVHKGLGEMQQLAQGVGDLKRIFSNIRARGLSGEERLSMLIEDILTPEQYSKNVKTKKESSESVEYAIKLPGRDEKQTHVWLPIDSKFPLTDYEKLIKDYETGDKKAIEADIKNLENKIKEFARQIKEKYIDPPNTTDFGIMFLPTEGLFAEVVRIPGLSETLRREYNVVITGPTTLAAFLNSLQIGFRTLAIEKRSSEIWGLLAAIKTEFGKFEKLLQKTGEKLNEASKHIEEATRKTKIIERKLKDVQTLPESEATKLLEEHNVKT